MKDGSDDLLISPAEAPRFALEHQANQTRARLVGTIDELDRRGHQLFDLGAQLRRHANDILTAAGGLVFAAGATVAIFVYRHQRRVRRIRQERVRALVRVWSHPERLAERQSVAGTALRMVLVALAAMATTTLATRQIDRLRRRPRLPAHPNEPLGL